MLYISVNIPNQAALKTARLIWVIQLATVLQFTVIQNMPFQLFVRLYFPICLNVFVNSEIANTHTCNLILPGKNEGTLLFFVFAPYCFYSHMSHVRSLIFDSPNDYSCSSSLGFFANRILLYACRLASNSFLCKSFWNRWYLTLKIH